MWNTLFIGMTSGLFMLTISPHQIFCDEPKPEKKEYIIVNHPSYNPGMFSVFNSVAGFLDLYEKGDFAGIEVNFEDKGLYYDQRQGSNWWEYYCQAIKLGRTKNAKVKQYSGEECGERAWHTEEHMSRQRVNELIKKYIIPSRMLSVKVDQFVEKNFKGKFIIGVHYRGTDKKSEAPKVPYEGVEYMIKKKIKELGKSKYMLFVATDEQDFLDHMKVKFPARLVYIKAMRSKDGQPIHFNNESNYEKGEQAMMDMLLLSKTNYLIRTSSNLSLWSTYFNPDLDVHLINRRF